MIPKTIHYCWFGGKPKPEIVLRCIESWRRILPDYTICEWNEKNYDVTAHPYTAEAYRAKKWAFVSDYARLDILYRHGGIYFDTDVEVLKPFDRFLEHPAFCGMETTLKVATGLVAGCAAGNEMIKCLRDEYDNRHFRLPDGTYDLTSCPVIQTQTLTRFGFIEKDVFQEINGLAIYPSSWFCPRSPGNRPIKTAEAYSIHYGAASWFPLQKKWKKKLLSLLGEQVVWGVRLKRILLKKTQK